METDRDRCSIITQDTDNKSVPPDIQGIFLGMKDIPTRDVSALAMVRNLIIGSVPRATSRKMKPAERQKNTVTSLPQKTQCSKRDIARVEKL